MVDILKRAQTDSPDEIAESAEVQEQFFDFTSDVISWASPEFIAQYKKFRQAGGKGELQKATLHLDDMLSAMRKDLGHRDWRLSRGDLVALLIQPDEADFDGS